MAGLTDVSPAAKGFGELVGALTGRDRIREAARQKTMGTLADLAKGEIAADEFRQRQTLEETLSGRGGIDPRQAAILSAVFRSGAGNFQQGTGGLQNLADLVIQSQARDIAGQENPDVAMFNRILATRSGAGGGPLSAEQAQVAPLGEAMVQRARNQAALEAARVATEGARRGSFEAQAEARRNPFKVGKPGQQVYTPPAGSLGDIAPSTTPPGAALSENIGAFIQDFVENEGVAPTPAQLQTIAQGGTVQIQPKQPVSTKREERRANARVQQIGGRTVVRVGSPAEAKAAWAKLANGQGLLFPSGEIRYKE